MPKFIKAEHDKKNLTVQYVCDNGSVFLKTGGTIAWRFNNPGNMRPKSKGIYLGQIGVGETASGKFVIFESYEVGRKEKKSLLRRKYNNYSLKDAIYIYAPPKENNTEDYIDFIVKKTSIKRTTILSTLSDKDLEQMMDAMQEKEGYSGKLGTRQEKWIHTTSVTVTDGTQPIANQSITIRIGDYIKEFTTNKFGNLPLIPHTQEGEKIVFSTVVDKFEKVIGEISISAGSKALLFLKEYKSFSAKLMQQNGKISDVKKSNYIYTVKSGDNISKISKRFNVSVKQIIEWNNLNNPNQIYAGQNIIIGYFKKEKLRKKNSENIEYEVKENDNIYKICKLHKININDFKKENPDIKNLSLIKVGQKVQIPQAQLSNSKNSISKLPQDKNTNSAKDIELTRSKAGTGEGLAILPINNKEAPWMSVVLRELTQWYGKKENSITKIDNYHELTGTQLNTMVGSQQAWCASFVNYCLQAASYNKSKEPASALSFRRDTQNFIKIPEPIYGALATIPTARKANPETTSGQGHVAFVYSLDKTNGYFLMIGGNQDDQITIVSRKISAYRFYVPKVYYNFATKQKLDKKMTIEDVYSLLGLKLINTGISTR